MGGTGGTVWVGGVVTAGVDMGGGSALSATQIPTQSGVYNYTRNNFVSSFNGATGAVGGVTTSVANTFTALQTFSSGISASLGATFSRDIFVYRQARVGCGGTTGYTAGFVNALLYGDDNYSNTTLGVLSSQNTLPEYGPPGDEVSTGVFNTAVGVEALRANTSGLYNTALGAASLKTISTGAYNTAVGAFSSYLATGSFNSALGYAALISASGSDNCAVGTSSLSLLTTGSSNTAVGTGSLSNITTSRENTALGNYAGAYRTAGIGFGLTGTTGGIYIGSNSLGTSSSTNEIVIGRNAQGLGSNTAVIGATTQTAATIYGLVSATNGVSAGGVSTFNAGVTFASTTDHTGVARFATGVTVSGRLDVGGVLDVVSGTTLESTLNVVGNARFAAGVTTSTLYVSGGSTFAAAINAPGIVSSWTVITADQTAEINKGYLTNKATVLGLTLPSSAAVGSMIRVSGMTTAGWKITQNASQVIHFGKTDTTVGTAGYLQSTLARDGVELVCCVANNEWNVVSSVGNITIV